MDYALTFDKKPECWYLKFFVFLCQTTRPRHAIVLIQCELSLIIVLQDSPATPQLYILDIELESFGVWVKKRVLAFSFHCGRKVSVHLWHPADVPGIQN